MLYDVLIGDLDGYYGCLNECWEKGYLGLNFSAANHGVYEAEDYAFMAMLEGLGDVCLGLN